jgi:hypothetical protein
LWHLIYLMKIMILLRWMRNMNKLRLLLNQSLPYGVLLTTLSAVHLTCSLCSVTLTLMVLAAK